MRVQRAGRAFKGHCPQAARREFIGALRDAEAGVVGLGETMVVN